MKKHSLIILIVLLLVACILSFDSAKNKLEVSPKDKTVFELVTKTYSYEQLKDIWMCADTITELNEKYSIECLRETNGEYRAVYAGKNNYTALFFDIDGKMTGGWVYKISPKKSEFADIREGMTVSEVQEIDPFGWYMFLYSGSDLPKISMHFTQDGYLLTIKYDDSCKIVDIRVELI